MWSKISALLLLLVLATCGVAVGQTPTATSTVTRTSTATGTVTQTGTITQTGTVTATATATRTPTIKTPTATRTKTQTRTVTQTRTATATGTATTTILATATSTNTPVSTATFGSTPTPTGLTFKLILNDPMTNPPDLNWAKELVRRLSLPAFCDTSTCGGGAAAATATSVSTATATITSTATITPTVTSTPTDTSTPTATGTATFTATPYNAWSVIDAPVGTDPVADIPGDTFVLTSSNCTITGNSGTDTVDFNCPGSGGSTNSFETWDTPAGTDIVADSATDTVQFLAAGIMSISGGGAADTITFTATEVDGSTTNELQNIFQTFDTSSGTDPVADTTTDTLILTGTSPIVVTGNSAADSVTYSWDFSVANTWTGLQTFDASILLPDNDTVTLGTGSDATLSYNGTDTLFNPDAVGVGGLKYQGLSTIEIGDGGGTSTTTATYQIAFYDNFTIDTAAGYTAPIVVDRIITWEQDPNSFIMGFTFAQIDTHTNPVGETRVWGPYLSFHDATEFIADTTPGTSTLNSYTSFNSLPSLTRTGAGAFTIAGALIGSDSTAIIGAGVTLAARIGYRVQDLTVTGTLTEQVGVKINNLTAAATDWSMQIGSAPSYHVGDLMLQGTAVPADALSFSGQAAEAIRMARHTTAATAGNSLTFQAGGAVSGGTDLAGGSAIITGGIATGNGQSTVQIAYSLPNQGAGTADRSPVKHAEFEDGHLEFKSTTIPTITAGCGTTPAIAANSTDVVGNISTTGSTASTTCTVTFFKGWTNAPVCIAQNATNTNALRVSSTTTTTMVLTYASSTAIVVNWHCFGREA